MGRTHVFKCQLCGRDIPTVLPLLILQVIEWMGQHLPIKTLFTSVGKCKYCHEMRDYDETQIDEDTEEITVDQFNALVQARVPVMKQVVPMPGGEEEEEDEESTSKRRIGFCSEED
jgi:hypothetical protein